MSSRNPRGAALVFIASLALSASAAASNPGAATSAAGPAGFEIRGSGDEFRIRIGGYFQIDERQFVEETPGATAGFLARRIRCVTEGTVHRDWEFRVVPELGGGDISLRDAWIGLRVSPSVSVRAGRFKVPCGIERAQSSAHLLFGEHGLPTNLVPAWDVGVALHGEGGPVASWAIGVFNGVPDRASSDRDVSDGKDVAARVIVQPLRNREGHPLRGLGLGVAGTWGREEGDPTAPALPQYRSPGQQTLFRYRSDGTAAGTAVADGTRQRISPQASFHGGRLAVLAEHVTSSQRVRRGARSVDLLARAEQLALGVMLTEDETTAGRVSPRHPFREGGAGAWQVVARIGRLRIDRDAFPELADPTRSAREAVSWGIGLNGYLNRSVRTLLDWEATRFEGGAALGDRADERVLLGRLQISF